MANNTVETTVNLLGAPRTVIVATRKKKESEEKQAFVVPKMALDKVEGENGKEITLAELTKRVGVNKILTLCYQSFVRAAALAASKVEGVVSIVETPDGFKPTINAAKLEENFLKAFEPKERIAKGELNKRFQEVAVRLIELTTQAQRTPQENAEMNRLTLEFKQLKDKIED